MTISYTDSFQKIVCRWKGSLWKACWKELILYLLCYYTIGIAYRLAMTEEQKRVFERVVVKMNGVVRAIPITFLLGFYVTNVFQVTVINEFFFLLKLIFKQIGSKKPLLNQCYKKHDCC